MNLKWNVNAAKDRGLGCLYGAFEAKCDDISVLVTIFATPSMKEFQSKRVIFAKVYIKAEQISDGGFHAVSDDVYEIAKQYCNPVSGDLMKTYFCEYYYVDRIPRQMPFAYGDYTYSEQ